MLEEPIKIKGVLNVGEVTGGTGDYTQLQNKPKINSVELDGNKTSEDLGLQPAGEYLTEETEPAFSNSPAYNITNQNISNWNNKSNFSGDYNDLTNKPVIPSNLSELNEDTTHRVVTDTEKSAWNAKAEVSDIPDVSNFITKSVNDLTNYYLKNEVYTKQEVANLIGAIQQFHYEVVQQLPAVGQTNIMYLTLKTTSETQNVYDEYVYANNNWEKIGDTKIDLTGYVTTTMLNTALADYVTNTNLASILSNYVLNSSLSTVATSGDYDDLNNKPTIPIVPTNLSSFIDDLGSSPVHTHDDKQNIIQYSTMPTASESNLGKIIQYTGASDSTYTNGYFYICVSDGQTVPTYSWENVNVQGGGNNTIPLYWVAWGSNTNETKAIFQEIIEKINNNESFNLVTYKSTNEILYCCYVNKGYVVVDFQFLYINYSNSPVFIQLPWIRANITNNVVTSLTYQNHSSTTDTLYFLTSDQKTNLLTRNNNTSYNVTNNYNPAHKLYVDQTHYENMSGYDATKTQVLKNINGTLTWVDET